MEETDPKAALLELATELISYGWYADLRSDVHGDVLRVANPNVSQLNDRVIVREGAFRWPWGNAIGGLDDVEAVAARIRHVLREVGSA
ncbi:hypothetical protein [Actinomadura rupiterrae]|uniref:hypothetical protein n=1 Tax=Actinomadura rupiterrae TaxID=559627 RepID=UPI0020A3FF09|nr:hypothetical protein [Actinomadura rupiterrae]MCP2339138.1 N12 class adenine-specific DNA methylase [Actinomadura rupiterrae]